MHVPKFHVGFRSRERTPTYTRHKSRMKNIEVKKRSGNTLPPKRPKNQIIKDSIVRLARPIRRPCSPGRG